MDPKLAAIVVFYNPNYSVKKNIGSYINDVEKLYIVDNSEKKDEALIAELRKSKKVFYIDNGDNKGIANALNIGAEFAIKNRFNYLLTMDQDSKFKPNEFKKFINCIDYSDRSVGLHIPQSFLNESTDYPFSNLVSITSGALLNLKIFQKIGPFQDDLFIDSVDIEYCLRLHKRGFVQKRVESIVLDHQLGNIQSFKFLWWKFSSTQHSALRRYYMVRNRFYIWKKYKSDYPEYIKFEKYKTLKETIKIILVETNKFQKIKMSIMGYLDYKNNKYGKYES